MITEQDIKIENTISPYIYINRKCVGVWWWDTKTITFDYCLKFFGIDNTQIVCSRDEIKNKIMERFNKTQKL